MELFLRNDEMLLTRSCNELLLRMIGVSVIARSGKETFLGIACSEFAEESCGEELFLGIRDVKNFIGFSLFWFSVDVIFRIRWSLTSIS